MPNIAVRSATTTPPASIRSTPLLETRGRGGNREFDRFRGNVDIQLPSGFKFDAPIPKAFKLPEKAPLTEVITIRKDLVLHWVEDMKMVPIGDHVEQAAGFRVKMLPAGSGPVNPFNILEEGPVEPLSLQLFFQKGVEAIVEAIATTCTKCAVRAEKYRAVRTRTSPRKWRVQKQRTP
jgi:hypothetical protein